MLERRSAVDQLKGVWRILSADLDAAVAYGRNENTPYAQRALVRAHFALVEGLSFTLRQVTLATLQATEILSEKELGLLREKRYSLDNQGRPQEATQFLKFPESILFSIRCYARNHGTTFEPDTQNNSGWSALCSSVKVRDRVTHPKTVNSLTLTDSDLQLFVDGAKWWKQTVLDLMAACEEADKHYSEKTVSNSATLLSR